MSRRPSAIAALCLVLSTASQPTLDATPPLCTEELRLERELFLARYFELPDLSLWYSDAVPDEPAEQYELYHRGRYLGDIAATCGLFDTVELTWRVRELLRANEIKTRDVATTVSERARALLSEWNVDLDVEGYRLLLPSSGQVDCEVPIGLAWDAQTWSLDIYEAAERGGRSGLVHIDGLDYDGVRWRSVLSEAGVVSTHLLDEPD